MLRRLRKILVRSYIGAIGLGYLLASCVWHFADIFSAPIAAWISHKEYGRLMTQASSSTMSDINPLRYALPELARFACLALVWYALMHWLYLKPQKQEGPQTNDAPQ